MSSLTAESSTTRQETRIATQETQVYNTKESQQPINPEKPQQDKETSDELSPYPKAPLPASYITSWSSKTINNFKYLLTTYPFHPHYQSVNTSP